MELKLKGEKDSFFHELGRMIVEGWKVSGDIKCHMVEVDTSEGYVLMYESTLKKSENEGLNYFKCNRCGSYLESVGNGIGVVCAVPNYNRTGGICGASYGELVRGRLTNNNSE